MDMLAYREVGARMTERWRPIPGYEGLYEVSSLGRVRSIPRLVPHPRNRNGTQLINGRILRERIHKRHGYPAVSLCKSGKAKKINVHRLVLTTFVGPRPPGFVTRHLNGDRRDSRLENLTYGTSSENMIDRVDHGNDPHAKKTHCKNGHELAGENVRRGEQRDGLRRGYRACRVCNRERCRRWYEQNRKRQGANRDG